MARILIIYIIPLAAGWPIVPNPDTIVRDPCLPFTVTDKVDNIERTRVTEVKGVSTGQIGSSMQLGRGENDLGSISQWRGRQRSNVNELLDHP